MVSIIFKMQNEYVKLRSVTSEKKSLLPHMKSCNTKNGWTQEKQDLIFSSTYIFTAESKFQWLGANTILHKTSSVKDI